ncbi:hypothetical protein ACFLW5_02010 [Chloroflexota bacterium]
MPGKSQSRGRKHSTRSKKAQGRPSQPTGLAQQPTVSQNKEPIPPPVASAPSSNMPARMEETAAVQYPYIAAELWTISILASIMLIILAVLASVLS